MGRTKFPIRKKWLKKFNKNNRAFALNALHARKKICSAYILKNNSNSEKQVILLMIPNGDGCIWSKTSATWAKSKRWCHYVEAKKLSALLRRIRSKYNGDFYVSIAFILFQQKTNVNLVKTYGKINIFVTL